MERIFKYPVLYDSLNGDSGLDYLQSTYSLILSLIAALFHWKEIHTKSLEEHVVDAWRTSTLDPVARTQKVSNKHFRPVFYPPAYRCVRVKVFSGGVSRLLDDTCLFSDFYLDDGGNLNLNLVRKRWDLDQIQAVLYSPNKGLRLVMLDNMDLMPAKHVDALKGHDGCIRIIEVPSQTTIKIRRHRKRLMELLTETQVAGGFFVALVALLLIWIGAPFYPAQGSSCSSDSV